MKEPVDNREYQEQLLGASRLGQKAHLSRLTFSKSSYRLRRRGRAGQDGRRWGWCCVQVAHLKQQVGQLQAHANSHMQCKRLGASESVYFRSTTLFFTEKSFKDYLPAGRVITAKMFILGSWPILHTVHFTLSLQLQVDGSRKNRRSTAHLLRNTSRRRSPARRHTTRRHHQQPARSHLGTGLHRRHTRTSRT